VKNEIKIVIYGRRCGKTAIMLKRISELETQGNWVVVAGPGGFHCSRCKLEPKDCTCTRLLKP